MFTTAARHRSSSLLIGLSLVLVAAGCATTLAGTPLMAVTVDRSPGIGEGHVPDGVRLTVDEDLPAVTELDPDLLTALRTAAAAAAADGVDLRVNSGWRSERYQQWLLDEAVREHGSYEEARRWVATPEESRHVGGHAVDVGPPAAAEWLNTHGAQWGLCRVYANEPWHFEMRAENGVCPGLLADAAG